MSIDTLKDEERILIGNTIEGGGSKK